VIWGIWAVGGRGGGGRWIWGATGSGLRCDFDGDYDFRLLICYWFPMDRDFRY